MVKKLRKPAIVYKIAPSGNNSELAGRKIVGVASVGDKTLSRGFVLSQSRPTFHLVLIILSANE